MINIGFTGDFCPWFRIEELYKKSDWKHAFDSVLPFFRKNQMNVFDLECPLVINADKITKTGPHIKADPCTVEIMKYLNLSLAATANNHITDYGEDGLKSTYSVLNSKGIKVFGSGLNYFEASKPLITKIGLYNFAFINATENEWSTTFKNLYGCNPLDPINIYYQIQSVKKYSDFIILILHGGHEYYNLPSPRMKKWYRFFIDSGADAIIGHHTHIISGYEIYNQKPIFYSLGNFCFDWPGKKNNSWNTGLLLRLTFDKNRKITYEIKFISQNDKKAGVFMLEGKEERILINNLHILNNIIIDENKLNQKFIEYSDSLSQLMNTWIQPYIGKISSGLHKRNLLPSLIGKRKKKKLTNLIRCESHRDILLNSLLKEK